MRRKEILEKLPEITCDLGTVSGVDIDYARQFHVYTYKMSIRKGGRSASIEYTHGETQGVKKSDLQQLKELGDFYSAAIIGNWESAKDKAVETSLGALARISETSPKDRSWYENMTIVRHTKLLATAVVYDAVEHPQWLSDSQKDALKTLSPLLPVYAMKKKWQIKNLAKG